MHARGSQVRDERVPEGMEVGRAARIVAVAYSGRLKVGPEHFGCVAALPRHVERGDPRKFAGQKGPERRRHVGPERQDVLVAMLRVRRRHGDGGWRSIQSE